MSLALNNIVLTYPDGESTVMALDHVSLNVDKGEMAAIVGPSGSGKSSLLAVAATLIKPDSGQVRINERDTGSLTPAECSRLRLRELGIVFQQPNLISSLTALEQLTITEAMRGESPRQRSKRAHDLLASIGMNGKQHRRPHQLSGGERQRVNIARALMGSPSVLLVDEPTAALDHERGRQIVTLLSEVTSDFNVATVLVTHDVEYLDAANSVAYMRDGSVSSQPSPSAA